VNSYATELLVVALRNMQLNVWNWSEFNMLRKYNKIQFITIIYRCFVFI